MCEVNATLPAMEDVMARKFDPNTLPPSSQVRDLYKRAATQMVAEEIVYTEATWKAVGYGNRATWFHSSLMAAAHVAAKMANTEEVRDAMIAAFTQALKAYDPLQK